MKTFVAIMMTVMFFTCAIWHGYTNENKTTYKKYQLMFYIILSIEFFSTAIVIYINQKP